MIPEGCGATIDLGANDPQPITEIDERVKAFLDRPIEGEWPYLWIDATYLKERERGRIVSTAVIVVAMPKTIFAQESAEAAHEQWHHVADAMRERYEKLAIMMDGSREEVLAYIGVPQGALGADLVHQPARARQQRDQAQGRCHRHLPQHRRGQPNAAALSWQRV